MQTRWFTEKTFLLLPLFLLLFLITGCSPTSNHFGVIFTINYDDIYQIPDNTQNVVEQLTFTPTIREYNFLVSKNGDRIGFQTEFYSNSDMEPSELAIEELRHVYLLDTINKEMIDVTNILVEGYEQVGKGFYWNWAPDERQIMTITYEGGDYRFNNFLKFIDLDGKNRKDILIPMPGEIPSLIYAAEWSPDGKKILLTQGVIGIKEREEYPGAAILIYDTKTEEVVQITDYQDHYFCFPHEWSPNSHQILATCAYVPPNSSLSRLSGPRTVRIFDIENPEEPYEHIAFSPCYDPSWSPDGKQIVFTCDKDVNQRGLFIANSNNSGIYEIELGDLGNPAILKNPTWSPDGTQIVYVAGSDGKTTKIYSVNRDGSNNRPLTNQEAYYILVSVYPVP